jgi:hypothetical protein
MHGGVAVLNDPRSGMLSLLGTPRLAPVLGGEPRGAITRLGGG